MSTPSRSRAWAIGIGLCIALAAGAIAWVRLRAPAATPRGEGGPVPVRTIAAARRDVPIHLEGVGTITPLQTAIVRPRVDGVLESVAFSEGQSVETGDLLAQIDPRPFRVALAQAQAVLARDSATSSQARTVLARDEQLHANNLLSTQDLEAQQALVGSLEATERADRAQLEAARLQLDYTRVVAPIDGLTGLRQIDPGNTVHATDPNGIVVIAQVDPIAVLFSLPQDELGAIHARMAQGTLSVEIFARDGSMPLAQGRLLLIDNRIDAQTATIRLKAEVPNADRALWPNQLVQVRLLLETRRGVLVVPDAAVQQGPEGSFVYAIENGRAVVRRVRIDRTEGELALVMSGLRDGDEVVVEGQSRLRPNARIDRGTGRRRSRGRP